MQHQQFSQGAKKALSFAEEAAREMKNSFIGTEHLLLGILKIKDSSLNHFLKNSGVTYDRIREDIIVLFGFCDEKNLILEYTRTMEEIVETSILDAKMQGKKTVDLDILTICLLQASNNVAVELLRRYDIDVKKLIDQIKMEDVSSLNKIQELTNLNEKMKNSKTSLVLREKQLEMIMQILCRKEKGNPLLLGEPGVGKTAIVEELAKRIAQGNVPDSLKNNLIFELNLNCLVAGTKYRGEFEEKIQKIIMALHQFPQVILFIDEIHQIVGAGKAEGSIDVAGVLKTHLARGKIRCIGSTTYDEYVQYIEKDRALQRRFQSVMVDEPTLTEAVEMVKCRLPEYQRYHRVEFSEDLVESLVKKSEYYLPERKLPDKAIDIVDLSCAHAKLDHRKKVNDEDIIKTIESMTSIPISNNVRSNQLYQRLKQCITDPETINKLKQSIQWLDLQIIDDRPLAGWMFKGDNTELKKEIVKLIGQYYFIQNDRLSWLDIREFKNGGMIGNLNFFQESTMAWIKKIKRNPYSILCIEHYEEAGKESVAFIKKILKEGKVELQNGSTIDFRHTLIILLDESKKQESIGFNGHTINNDSIEEIVDEVFVFQNDDEMQKLRHIKKRVDFYKEQLQDSNLSLDEKDFIHISENELDKKIKEKITKLLIKSS